MSLPTPETFVNPINRDLTSVLAMTNAEHAALEEVCASVIHEIGATDEARYFRAHSGIRTNGEVFRGGTRVPIDEVEVRSLGALAYDMLLKANPDDDFLGGKTFIIPKRKLSKDEMRNIVPRQYAEFMVDANFAGCFNDIPGADSGFVAPMTDAYAQRYRELMPADSYWLGSISSKSPENGGLEGRLEATGRGVYATIHALDNYLVGGQERPLRSVAIEATGAVGAATAMYLGQDDLRESGQPKRFKVDALNDYLSTLRVVSDPKHEGIILTEEMFYSICTNAKYKVDPEYIGKDKLIELKAAIEQNQPNLQLELVPTPRALFEGEYDYFVPAGVMKNTINEENAERIAKMIRLGLVEGCNDVTTAGAARIIAQRGVTRVPDFVANQQGVMGSGDEIAANIAQANAIRDGNVYVPATKKETLYRVDDRQISTMLQLFDLYKELQPNLIEAKVGLTIANAAKVQRLAQIAVKHNLISRSSIPLALAA